MKRTNYIIFLLASLIFSHADTLSVDINKSKLLWAGEKLSGKHDGQVNIKNGYVLFHHGSMIGAEIIIDMNTITVADIESPEWNQSLVDHLKDDDFFGVDSFPIATLSIESVEEYKSKLTPQYNVKMDGLIMIKGVSKPISILSNLNSENGYRASGTLKIDRTEFGIEYKSKSIFPNIGDKFIYDEFTLDFDFYTQ